MDERLTKLAIERYHNDARFHATCQSIVAQVMRQHGPVDPERADREANDIAMRVAVLTLETVYQNDSELHTLRAEKDYLQKTALEMIKMTPLPQ